MELPGSPELQLDEQVNKDLNNVELEPTTNPTHPTLLSFRIVPLARSGNISAEQLPLPDNQVADNAFSEFESHWNHALQELKDEKDANGSPKQPSLIKVNSTTFYLRTSDPHIPTIMALIHFAM